MRMVARGGGSFAEGRNFGAENGKTRELESRSPPNYPPNMNALLACAPFAITRGVRTLAPSPLGSGFRSSAANCCECHENLGEG